MNTQTGTVKQCIEATQQNHENVPAALAEWTDNSTDHGKATKVLIILTKASIIHIDNGIFDYERFNTAFLKTINPQIEKSYYSNLDGKIGRYNFGMTDAAWILGEVTDLYTTVSFSLGEGEEEKVIGNEIRVQSHDWEKSSKTNNINTSSRKANLEEARQFNEYMRHIGSRGGYCNS